MIEHLTQNQVEGYCRQALGSVEVLSVSDHLNGCQACRRRIEDAMNADAAFFALRSEVFGGPAELTSPNLVREHPTDEQTAVFASGFVDGNLAGEELQMIADHLTSCERCALTVDDLRAFRNQIAPSLEREYHPEPISPATEGWWHRAVAFLSGPFRRLPVLAFGAALMVLLFAVTAWFSWRTQREGVPEEEIAASPTTPSPPAPAPPPAQLVAQLNDGEHQLTLDQEGKLSGADDLPLAYQQLLKGALTNPRIEASPQLRGLSRPPSSLMSGDKQKSEFSLIDPVGAVLMTDAPTFRWWPMDGATGYIVEIYDSEFNLVAASPQLTNLSWAAQSLLRGKVYSWQVKAIKDGQEFKSPRPPAPQAKFRILDRAKANELARAKRDYPSSHLALGLLYADAGLLKEADQELRVLLKANPDSAIARGLLSQVQTLRRSSK